jgi:sulfur carrier protein
MTIIVNGVPTAIEAGTSVAALVRRQVCDPAAVVVEVNRRIVPRRTWEAAVLDENDTVEIVSFVGGG